MEGKTISHIYHKIREYLTFAPPSSGVASPNSTVFYETSDIPLADVMKLYDRDPTCKSSVDLLAASAVKRFYTTCAPGQEKAKAAIDSFCEEVNLDGLLHDMAVRLIACGNEFWLRLTPARLSEFVRMPIDSIEKIKLSSVQGLKIPYKVESYQLRTSYREGVGNGDLKPEAVLHWNINQNYNSGYGVGLLQVLLHTLSMSNDKRPAFAWMKAKIEKILPNIFVKYAGPDVVVQAEGMKDESFKKYENAIKKRPEEGQWLFSGAKNVSVNPVSIDPRARFEYYIDHIVNQFYLGCETPLPRLFSTPGFTEASAKAALELQDMLIDPIQRMVKRRVEREVFSTIAKQNGFDPVKAQLRLNWGNPETPEITAVDLISAAEKNLIRPDEFRKNAVKILGWELWDEKQGNGSKSNGDGGD
ncbi:MAG: hypothetical protein ACQCN6_03745 [Candidatus Bathyarchaeia archaeon]